LGSVRGGCRSAENDHRTGPVIDAQRVFCPQLVGPVLIVSFLTASYLPSPLPMVLQGRIVRALLRAGANVNAQQSTGHTPLHCCAMEGQERMMKNLLDAGANPTLASVEGQTALHTAAQVWPQLFCFVLASRACAQVVGSQACLFHANGRKLALL